MINTQTTPDLKEGLLAEAGEYLTFSVSRVTYGAPILHVREIIGAMEITAFPQCPPCVLGVINLRDQIIPVVDMRQRFDIADEDIPVRGCTIVVETHTDGQSRRVGLNVDRVSDVLEISAEQIEAAPGLGRSVEGRFVAGMAKVGAELVILLDIDRLLANQAGESASVVPALAA